MGLILVGAVWASEEDMGGEIDRKRDESEKRVLSGEGYGGGTRSHGLKLGKRLRDRVSVSMMDRFETDEIRVLGFYLCIYQRQRARVKFVTSPQITIPFSLLLRHQSTITLPQ